MSASMLAVQARPARPAADACATQVRICLLGQLRIVIDGRDVTSCIKYRKGIGLLALLAVERDVLHPRDRLADLFWPSLSLSAARTNLRQVLSNLARVLGRVGPTEDQPVLRVSSHSVGLFLEPGINLDVVHAQAVRLALHGRSSNMPADDLPLTAPALGTHEFLPGFDLPDCDAFAAWLDEQRRRFADGAIAVYEDLADRAAARGRYDIALEHAAHVEGIDPLLERNQVRLIQLLAVSGRSARALQQFELFADRLRRELDVDPEPATLRLRERIAKAVPMSDEATHAPPRLAKGRRSWRAVVVVYACCAVDDNDAFARAAQVEDLRMTLKTTFEQMQGTIIAAPGMGLYARFSDAAAALRAAQAVLANPRLASRVRIGIYSGSVMLENAAELPGSLYEVAELAARLSLIADDGEAVACADTVRRQSVEAEALGEWNFRGLTRPVTAFRLAQPAADRRRHARGDQR
ncbi:MAG TPA: BTAD domain-containing putative transcriptional regulator [Rhodanobacteraceae bacterium]|nr:BTAD domain-containing putative transcriptional regulator [Rhodanobacteraceae bacterium]